MFEALKQTDRDLFLSINSSNTSFLDALMWQFSQDWPTVVLCLIFLAFFYKKFELKRSLSLLLGIALVLACSDLSTNLIKHQVKRYRPSHNTEIEAQVHSVKEYKGGLYGFFSSHASNVFGLVTLFFCVSRRIQWRQVYLLYLYALLVGYSRIYLGVHYPSDILVGALNGLLWGFVMFRIVNTHFLKLDALEN